ncbi:MAG TPA: hypothetical protein VGP99_01010 [Tepidisphaeraceae bacterium]|nr:hypothetical protein [Tepidisphaeraceae bacterium]
MRRNSLLLIVVFCGLLMNQARAAAPTTRPTAATLDRQIAELIAQLDSPDAVVRERATAKLINLGPRVLKPLREALAVETSPEFAERAKTIIEEISRQWKYVNEIGGNVVGGFQATLESRTNTFAMGRPISLSLVFRCVGVNGHRLAETRTIDIELDGGTVFSAPQSEGKLVVKKVGDAKLPLKASPIVCNSGEPHSIDFNVGGSVNTALWIEKELELAPGEYEVTYVYYALTKALLEEALEDLQSNTLRLKITGQ